MTTRVALCDLGLGNLRSVERALVEGGALAGVDVSVEVTRDARALLAADRVVVPGQGAFRDGAAALEGELGDALREALRAGKPYLGICLGLQLLFETSAEAPGARGLGWFEGGNAKLVGDRATKVPHMGWSPLSLHGAPAALEAASAVSPWFYFVHSFHPTPLDRSIVVATARHGDNVVTAAVAKDHVLAVQFHPEKSQRAGLELLGRFLA